MSHKTEYHHEHQVITPIIGSKVYHRLQKIIQHLIPSELNINHSSDDNHHDANNNNNYQSFGETQILVDNSIDFDELEKAFRQFKIPSPKIQIVETLPTFDNDRTISEFRKLDTTIDVNETNGKIIEHFSKSNVAGDAAEDELDVLVKRAEDMRIQEELTEKGTIKKSSGKIYEVVKYMPHLIVPTYVEESTRAGMETRERRRQRIKILYDVQTTRAQTPAFLDVSQDDPKTPLAFRYIRIILTTAEARRAQDIHLDQYSANCMSIVYATQLGVTGKLVLKGAVVQSIIYYIAFYDLLSAGKAMPGAVRDYSLKIKVRSHDFLQGTFNVYRVNCIRTNHELGLFHIVMRTLQN
ncbi:predicted protein [Naegleria gruberi]|uniref:Predicted protein n=1 Tax=Naegleria gruberi TaxID=5762 RepID=D2UZ43_NAEGR|nr:uncharacterized protein NAEGRDRAFT_45391 [Naegleria gruberi]EFC50086.1 predicted protein [Naegleria gruberi]|eukprot:XP_002682830.1 predicted protein [Naegleria gruberi strain NEG-M]